MNHGRLASWLKFKVLIAAAFVGFTITVNFRLSNFFLVLRLSPLAVPRAVNDARSESGLGGGGGPPSMRIALVMFGILDHDNPNLPDRVLPPPEESLTRSFGSIQKHVIKPAEEKGYDVDVFAHSWNFEEADLIRKVYQPNGSLFEPVNGRNMFDSIEAGLRLRRDFERNASITYDWVLVMRHDIFFYNKYDVTELNNDIFYVTNWCFFPMQTELREEQKEWGSQHGSERCVALETFDKVFNETFEHGGGRSVPDFMFVGSPRDVDLVFINLTTDLEKGVFQRGKSCCGHEISGGRIFSLYDAGLLRVGRYKVHAFDMCILRDWTAAQEALSDMNGGLWLRPNLYDVTEEHLYSQCSNNARYCFNVSNNSCPFPPALC